MHQQVLMRLKVQSKNTLEEKVTQKPNNAIISNLTIISEPRFVKDSNSMSVNFLLWKEELQSSREEKVLSPLEEACRYVRSYCYIHCNDMHYFCVEYYYAVYLILSYVFYYLTVKRFKLFYKRFHFHFSTVKRVWTDLDLYNIRSRIDMTLYYVSTLI